MCYIDVYVENFTRFASRNSKIKLVAFIKFFSFIQMLIHTILYSRFFCVFYVNNFLDFSILISFYFNKISFFSFWLFFFEFFRFEATIFRVQRVSFWKKTRFCIFVDQIFLLSKTEWFQIQKQLQLRFIWNNELIWPRNEEHAMMIFMQWFQI